MKKNNHKWVTEKRLLNQTNSQQSQVSQSLQVRAVHTAGELSDLVSLQRGSNSSNARGVDIVTFGYDGSHSVYHRGSEICAV